MRASTLEHTFPRGGLSLRTRHPPAQNLSSICRVLCLLVLWGPLDRGPCLCVSEADRTSADGWTPAAGDMARVGWGWVRVWEGGRVHSRVIRGNVFRASGAGTSGELDSPNPLLLGVASGGFMSPRWTWACGDVTGRDVREAPLHKRVCLQMLAMCSNCCPFAWLLQIVCRGAAHFSSTLLFQTFLAASGLSQDCGLRRSCSVFGGSDMFQQAGWAFFSDSSDFLWWAHLLQCFSNRHLHTSSFSPSNLYLMANFILRGVMSLRVNTNNQPKELSP